MQRLIDRNRQIPNGFRFRQPETGWESSRFESFDTIVNRLISHRLANPYLVQKHGWPTDYDNVAYEVDAYNALVCAHMGWNQYIVSDSNPPPKYTPPSKPSVIRAAAAGAETLSAWLGEGGIPVNRELAESRAGICSDCPQNSPKTWKDFFNVSAQAFMQGQLEKKNEMKLETSIDDKLGVCQACLCPMKLKVWTPLKHILAKMPADVKPRLDPRCWILKETPAT